MPTKKTKERRRARPRRSPSPARPRAGAQGNKQYAPVESGMPHLYSLAWAGSSPPCPGVGLLGQRVARLEPDTQLQPQDDERERHDAAAHRQGHPGGSPRDPPPRRRVAEIEEEAQGESDPSCGRAAAHSATLAPRMAPHFDRSLLGSGSAESAAPPPRQMTHRASSAHANVAATKMCGYQDAPLMSTVDETRSVITADEPLARTRDGDGRGPPGANPAATRRPSRPTPAASSPREAGPASQGAPRSRRAP